MILRSLSRYLSTATGWQNSLDLTETIPLSIQTNYSSHNFGERTNISLRDGEIGNKELKQAVDSYV